MSREHIPVAVRRLVAERAQGRCEYCLLHQDDTPFTHPLDHIIAIRHGGATTAENLALACIDCNQNMALLPALLFDALRLFDAQPQRSRLMRSTVPPRLGPLTFRTNDPC
ncbi:MAG: HNH endonuclease [Caldilineaceae bacterium]|nr:HNH endonuclease [Caldilineaceae bacterium]MCB9157401.1 HNH endonuclease [Caldilineaceae bacterium]